ncbi:MAG: NUDIX domain-containing protein [Microthrixaceae bacterium]
MGKGSDRVQTVGLKVYAAMPDGIRQRVVRTAKPSFTVGSMAVITRPDAAILLIRHTYVNEWAIPGGLLNRRERIEVGAAREALEEVGVRISLVGEPAVRVDPYKQIVRVIYRACLAEGVDPADAHAASPEVSAVRWVSEDRAKEILTRHSVAALEALQRAEGQRIRGRPAR